MRIHLTSPHPASDLGRGHHREFRLAIGERSTHDSAVEQATQTFNDYVAQGGKGTLDITTVSLLGIDYACFVYHGEASHALRPRSGQPA